MQGNETLEDVVRQLDHAEEYVRLALGNMMTFRRRAVEPVIRIGITGEGKVPNYRIEPAPKGDGTLNDIVADLDDIQAYMDFVKAFNGRSHKDMNWGALQLKGGHWSSAAMTIDDVQALLGNIRGLKRSP